MQHADGNLTFLIKNLCILQPRAVPLAAGAADRGGTGRDGSSAGAAGRLACNSMSGGGTSSGYCRRKKAGIMSTPLSILYPLTIHGVLGSSTHKGAATITNSGSGSASG